MAEPIIIAEKPVMMTIDEVGRVVPASPQTTVQNDEDCVSWFIWCDCCSKMIKIGLSASSYAHSLSELHREENPNHPPNCIRVMSHVNVIFEDSRF